MRPEGPVSSFVGVADDAHVLVYEHGGFELIHESHIAIVARTVLLKNIVGQAMQGTNPSLCSVNAGKRGIDLYELVPISNDPILQVFVCLIRQGGNEDRVWQTPGSQDPTGEKMGEK